MIGVFYRDAPESNTKCFRKMYQTVKSGKSLFYFHKERGLEVFLDKYTIKNKDFCAKRCDYAI